jgi:hypothetical protein
MTATMSAVPLGTQRDDPIERLRHPHEKLATLAFVLLNLAIVALGWIGLKAGGDWLAQFPRLHLRPQTVQGLTLALVTALPAAVLGRRTHLFVERANGLQVSAAQLPEIHAELHRACDRLGLDEVPELYVRRGLGAASRAYSMVGRRSVVVLDGELFEKTWKDDFDCIAFALANALGTLRLGHTSWWIEVLTAYSVRIPLLKNRILFIWTLSRDRCAAYVVPDGIRGLIIHATGKTLIGDVDVSAYLDQVKEQEQMWERVGVVSQPRPALTTRARALYRCGLFDWERDRHRHRGGPSP